MTDIAVKGLSQLGRFLQQLPANVERNVIRGALRTAAMVVKEAAAARAPVGPATSFNEKKYHDYEGALRDSLRVSVRVSQGRVIASVKAGGVDKQHGTDTYYAYWLEFTGAAAHIIAAGKGHGLFFNGRYAKIVQHPGFKPRPFMRPALQASAQAATVAAAQYMKDRLQSGYGMDTSGVDIQAE